MSAVVGVLALQGGFDKHVEMLDSLGIKSLRVRFADELDNCCGLIIPGGESTTMSLLIQKFDLYNKLREFAEKKPVMGVCAGAILMAETVADSRVISLDIMPMSAVRNNYGRQDDSFSTELSLNFDQQGMAYQGHFIRAPSLSADSEDIETLVSYKQQQVMLRMNWHVALSFHPELTNDNRIHAYWLKGFHPEFK